MRMIEHHVASASASASGVARESLPGRRLAAAAVLLTVVALATSACGGSSSAPSAPSATPARSTSLATSVERSPTAFASATTAPTAPAIPSPPPAQALDPIVRALQSRDWGTIRPFLQERSEPCITTASSSSESPLCPPGTAAGAPVQVFPVAGCHNFVAAAELEDQFAAKGPDIKLYAIYRASAQHPRVSRLPAGDVGVVLDRGGGIGQIFTIAGSKIVGADFGCSITPQALAALIPANAFLMRPPGQ